MKSSLCAERVYVGLLIGIGGGRSVVSFRSVHELPAVISMPIVQLPKFLKQDPCVMPTQIQIERPFTIDWQSLVNKCRTTPSPDTFSRLAPQNIRSALVEAAAHPRPYVQVVSVYLSQKVVIADELPLFGRLCATILVVIDESSENEWGYAAVEHDDLIPRFHPRGSEAEITLVGLEDASVLYDPSRNEVASNSRIMMV
jgi:hypothetical protein